MTRSPPSVTFPLQRSILALQLVWSGWAFGALAVAAWSLRSGSLDWRHMLAAVAVILAALAARTSQSSELADNDARLRWDGQGWHWVATESERAVRPVVHQDFQSLLLVRLQGDHAAMWMWLERSACPERWLDLRRALYAKSPAQASDSAGSYTLDQARTRASKS